VYTLVKTKQFKSIQAIADTIRTKAIFDKSNFMGLVFRFSIISTNY